MSAKQGASSSQARRRRRSVESLRSQLPDPGGVRGERGWVRFDPATVGVILAALRSLPRDMQADTLAVSVKAFTEALLAPPLQRAPDHRTVSGLDIPDVPLRHPYDLPPDDPATLPDITDELAAPKPTDDFPDDLGMSI